MHYGISTFDHATEIYLEPESAGLEPLLNRGDTTLVVNVPAPSRCVWCCEPVVSIHYPNRGWVYAEVFADEGGALCADLLREHSCKSRERHAHRLDATDAWEGDGQ
jgi:hypothetical protein